MSRVTPPVTKLTTTIRSLSTSSTARSTNLYDQSRHVSLYLPKNINSLKNDCAKRSLPTGGNKLDLADRLTAHDLTPARDFHSSTSSRPIKTLPLMQGFRSFRTSSPQSSAHDTSTIDYFFMPDFQSVVSEPVEKLRVPLLPDNYHPDRSPTSAHAAESQEISIPRPEISVVAAHPEMVLPAMLSEVVGNEGGMDVDIGRWTRGFTINPEKWMPAALSEGVAHGEEGEKEGGGGVLRELWTGVVDDIFGEKRKPA